MERTNLETLENYDPEIIATGLSDNNFTIATLQEPFTYKFAVAPYNSIGYLNPYPF